MDVPQLPILVFTDFHPEFLAHQGTSNQMGNTSTNLMWPGFSQPAVPSSSGSSGVPGHAGYITPEEDVGLQANELDNRSPCPISTAEANSNILNTMQSVYNDDDDDANVSGSFRMIMMMKMTTTTRTTTSSMIFCMIMHVHAYVPAWVGHAVFSETTTVTHFW